MPIQIINKKACTGCEACSNICPKNCIEMRSDEQGFSYPFVIQDMCIECGLCSKICPIINVKDKSLLRSTKVEVYAGWSLNPEIRYESTSGGFFSELAKVILASGGYVVGAAYNANCDVEHSIISDFSDIGKIRQSKYTQSAIKDIYRKIKTLLQKDEMVFFCGAPCQVAGLKAFLRKEYENLYTADFICRGMNSPKAYRHWLHELEENYQSRAVRVWFKYKQNGWKKSPLCTRIDFADGRHCIQSDSENTYMKGYLGPNLYIRPSCGKCHFKDIYRESDITLADFWGIKKELDDDKGTSLVLLNTEKGKALFQKCSESVYAEQRELKEIFEGNACFKQSVQINPQSEKFLRELDKTPFSVLIDKYTKVSIHRKLINKMKSFIRKIKM